MDPALDIAGWLNNHLDGWSLVMGIRYISASADEVVAEIDVGPSHLQAYGIVHGGVHASIVESVTSVGAAIFAMQEGRRAVGLDNHTSFLRAMRAGKIRARATPLTRGRRTQVWAAELHDERGRLVAQGQVRHMVLEGDEVPASPATEGVSLQGLMEAASPADLVGALGGLPNDRLRGVLGAAAAAVAQGDPDRASRALRVLGALSPRLAAAVRGALHGPSPAGREESLRELAGWSPEALGVVGVQVLRAEPSAAVRAVAEELLSRLEPSLAPGFHAARLGRVIRESAEAPERERALTQLGRLDPEGAVSEARRLALEDPDSNVQRQALSLLGTGPAAEDVAARALASADSAAVREAALGALASLGRRDLLEPGISDRHPRVRLRAGALLARAAARVVFDPYEPGHGRAAALREAGRGEDAGLIFRLLADLIRDPVGEVAVAALELAGEHPELGSLMGIEPESEERALALGRALTARGGPEAEPALTRLVESPWESVQIVAIEGLAKHGGVASQDLLVSLSRSRVRNVAAAALKTLR